jgi:hypothetical protein
MSRRVADTPPGQGGAVEKGIGMSNEPKSLDTKWKYVCIHCRKSIKGKVYYQGGIFGYPCHKKCLVVIRRSKDGGI